MSEVKDMMIETITKTVRTVSHKSLSVPYVSYSGGGAPKIMPYMLVDLVIDYGTEPKCVEALMTMIEKSDCPNVAAWRMAIAERFADSNAEEVEEMQA
jgi:hypothetical protein